MTEHILVVDDTPSNVKLLADVLTARGYRITTAETGEAALAAIGVDAPDLVLLDVMLPGISGYDVCRTIRADPENAMLPVVLVTALDPAEERVQGLEAGADDYLVKPFEPRELVLRIQAILRRTATQQQRLARVSFGEYQFDLQSARLQKNGELLALTTGESQLLKALAEKAGEPVTRADLARALGSDSSERNVDVQITRLRKKIETASGRPLYIQTVRGAGYVLHADRS